MNNNDLFQASRRRFLAPVSYTHLRAHETDQYLGLRHRH